MFLAFIMAFSIRTRFDILNKRRDKQLAILPPAEKLAGDALAATREIPDNDVRFRYMT